MRAQTLALVLAAVALAPLAASSPLAYFGEGSGTFERRWNFTVVVDPADCVAADSRIVVHMMDGRWIPEAHSVLKDADDRPCSSAPVIVADDTSRVSGTPETGFVLDLSDRCTDRMATLGPLGSATPFTWHHIDLCTDEPRNSWLNATLDFTTLG